MNAAEATDIIATLSASYPRQEITTHMVEVYTLHLSPIPYTVGAKAAEQHILESPFFPTVFELRSRAKAISRRDAPTTTNDDGLERITPEQLEQLKAWSQTIGHRMDELDEDEEPMPGERWFQEHEDELARIAEVVAATDEAGAA